MQFGTSVSSLSISKASISLKVSIRLKFNGLHRAVYYRFVLINVRIGVGFDPIKN